MIRIVPANEVSGEGIQAVLGPRDCAARCQRQCRRLSVAGWIWRDSTLEQRTAMFCSRPPAAPGVAGHQRAGRLRGRRTGGVGRGRAAYGVPHAAYLPGAVDRAARGQGRPRGLGGHLLVVRQGFRGPGPTYDLARATIDHARVGGTRVVEAYLMITDPGREITWGGLKVGARQVFEDAGFVEVSRPTRPRVVMRVEFG